MQISVYQACCLLPDTENHVLYFRCRRNNRNTLTVQNRHLSTEKAVEMIGVDGISQLIRKRGFGFLVESKRQFIKADQKKAAAYAKACGVKFNYKKKA